MPSVCPGSPVCRDSLQKFLGPLVHCKKCDLDNTYMSFKSDSTTSHYETTQTKTLEMQSSPHLHPSAFDLPDVCSDEALYSLDKWMLTDQKECSIIDHISFLISIYTLSKYTLSSLSEGRLGKLWQYCPKHSFC